MERLDYARNEVARRYLDGKLNAAGAKAAMGRYWLQTPDQAAKTLRFIETYRSYVINYNLGRDLAAAAGSRVTRCILERQSREVRAGVTAPSSRSPVRIRCTCSTSSTKTLPSPTSPV